MKQFNLSTTNFNSFGFLDNWSFHIDFLRQKILFTSRWIENKAIKRKKIDQKSKTKHHDNKCFGCYCLVGLLYTSLNPRNIGICQIAVRTWYGPIFYRNEFALSNKSNQKSKESLELSMEIAQQITQAMCCSLILGICFLATITIVILIKTSQFEAKERDYAKYVEKIRNIKDNASKD